MNWQAPTGWLCPQCQRVNAPFVRQCQCRPAVTVTHPFPRFDEVRTGDPLPRPIDVTCGGLNPPPTFEEVERRERAEHLKKLAGWPRQALTEVVQDGKPIPTWGV